MERVKAVYVEPETRTILARMAWDNGMCRINQPLDRATYLQVNRVLESVGGKWNRKEKAHLFVDDAAKDALQDVISTGHYFDWTKINEFFETPGWLAQRMLDIAEVCDGISSSPPCGPRILEPSAGKGAIVLAALERGCHVTAIEQHMPYLEYLNNVTCGWPEAFEGHQGDFLAVPYNMFKPFDAVIMNPPFSRNQDMTHVRYASNFLRPGGFLISVMCPGWRYRSTKVATSFRELAVAIEAEWRPNPPGSFKTSGTNVESGLFIARRP